MFVPRISVAPPLCQFHPCTGPNLKYAHAPGPPPYCVRFTDPFYQSLVYTLEYWDSKSAGYTYPPNPTGRIRSICIRHVNPTWGKEDRYTRTPITQYLYPDEKTPW